MEAAAGQKRQGNKLLFNTQLAQLEPRPAKKRSPKIEVLLDRQPVVCLYTYVWMCIVVCVGVCVCLMVLPTSLLLSESK